MFHHVNSPSILCIVYCPVAQLVAHLTVNQGVVGSKPTRTAKLKEMSCIKMESDLVTLLDTIQDRVVLVRFLQWLDQTQRRVCADLEGVWAPVEFPTTRLLDEYFSMSTVAAGEECLRRHASPKGLGPVMDELDRRENVGSNQT